MLDLFVDCADIAIMRCSSTQSNKACQRQFGLAPILHLNFGKPFLLEFAMSTISKIILVDFLSIVLGGCKEAPVQDINKITLPQGDRGSRDGLGHHFRKE